MKEYILENDQLLVKFLDFGGSFTYFGLKEDGKNCIANFKNRNDYLNIPGPYLNALVGPYAGRIKEGKCDGFSLSHEGGHHLHGGKSGISKQYFNVNVIDRCHAELILNANHQGDGYPGSVNYKIIYTLQGNKLIIDYCATPQYRQPLNMTTHFYFNLDQNASEGIRNHVLHIPSSKRCPIATSGVPETIEMIEPDSAFDFKNALTIGQHFDLNPNEFEVTKGFDCPFLLDEPNITLRSNTKTLTITTNAPSLVVYTANYFDSSMIMDNDMPCDMLSHVALECQDAPNGMNIDASLTLYYDSAHPYTQHSEYQLSIK